ncbi:MAG: MBL fold metallo-hydrolase [Erysipelotrichia bacterium]|nr:MBL fold metallo-hydrolase [Erysipelotrichia bacterium]
MEIKRIVVSPFQTNCYILIKDQEAIVIDPGSGYKKIVELIGNHQLMAILLTHGHLDHIGAVDKLYKQYKCPIYACKDDEKMLRDPSYNTLASLSACVKAPINWLTSEKLVIGKFNIEVLYTPGHSKGSVMYIVENNLFSGDTLFHMSVGRVDLYGGSQHQLENSLTVLNKLDPQMKVYPGHDEPTTVGYELKYNPFLQ